MTPIKYRLYADGTVVHEDDFAYWDNSQPFYDDYTEVALPYGMADIAANFGLEGEVVQTFGGLRADGYSWQIAANLTMRRFQFDHL